VLGWALLTMLAVTPDHWLQLERCTGLDERALRELIGLELATPIGRRTVTVRCEPDAFRVTVHAEQRDHVRQVLRTAAMGDVPERYLAVEIAELVETSEYPPTAALDDAAPDDASSPPEPAAEHRAEPFGRWGWLMAGGRFELGGRPAAPAGGAGFVVGGRLWRRLSVQAELLGLGGARRVEPDGVRLGFVGGAGAALATFDAGPAMLHVGAGARVGEVWMRGVSGQGDVTGLGHRGTTWAPFLSAGVLGAVGRRGVMAAHLDAGWTVRPVRGFSGTNVVFTSGGPWLGVSLSGGIRLGR